MKFFFHYFNRNEFNSLHNDGRTHHVATNTESDAAGVYLAYFGLYVPSPSFRKKIYRPLSGTGRALGLVCVRLSASVSVQ